MPNAILYIRESTDEQAPKGYMWKYQQDLLRSYCLQHDITVLKLYKEDHSAKNFKRLVWAVLMKEVIKMNRSDTFLLMFTKWDRFSHNVSAAFMVIKTLRDLAE